MLRCFHTKGLLRRGSLQPGSCKKTVAPCMLRHRFRGLPRTTLQQTPALPHGLAHLVVDSTLPVLKIGVVASVGAFAAQHGMLSADARRALSKLAINVFTPALMITKLGAHTDLASALSLWYIGANVILCHFVGLGLGILHTKLLPTPPNLQHIIRVSSAIANTGNLPLVLVLGLIKSPDLPFNTAANADMAVSYIMLGWWYATLVQMPLGTLLLHKTPQQSTKAAPDSGSSSSKSVAATLGSDGTAAGASSTGPAAAAVPSTDKQEQAAHAGAAAATLAVAPDYLQQLLHLARQHKPAVITSNASSSTAAAQQSQHLGVLSAAAASQTVALLDRPKRGMFGDGSTASAAGGLMSMQLQLQNSAAVQQCELASSSSSNVAADQMASMQHHAWHVSRSAAEQDSKSLPLHLGTQQQQQQQQLGELWQQLPDSWRQQWGEVGQPLLQGVLSAPLLAGIVAITIGSCPALQEALFSPRGSLSLVGDVLDMLGQPLIPVLLLVLGANLSNGPQLASGAHLPAVNVAGVIGTKLLLSPVLGLAVVLAAQKVGLIGPTTDPLAVLVMMVAWATPTAVLVHSLSLVHKNGEDDVSALLFYEYLAAAVTLPLCSAVYLYVLGCCVPHVA